MIKLLIIISYFILAASSQAASFIELSDSNKKYWLKLVHYEESTWDALESLADGPDFFLSKNGKFSPELEFTATIKALSDKSAIHGQRKWHPQCYFPERMRFLKTLGYKFPKINCPDYTEWVKSLNVDSVSFIFSSSYPNNPASMFGHTLLRLNNKKSKNELLHYAVSFSALLTNDWGPLYVYRGLTGAYKAVFSLEPYYMKVKEYENIESRDLWEYHLNIPKDRIKVLINHLWELYSTTYFYYYFLDEHCSSVLAELLEVAMPNWELNNINRWYTLPLDIVKNIKKHPDSITSITARHSLKKKFEFHYENLNKNQTEKFHESLNNNKLENLDTTTLDVLLDYVHYRNNIQIGDISASDRKLLNKILLARSKHEKEFKARPKLHVKENDYPDLSHEPQKLTFSTIRRRKDNLINIEFKNGYHDLLARNTGIGETMEFEIFNFSFDYNLTQSKFDIAEADLIKIKSLHNYTFYDKQFSWLIDFGLERTEMNKCVDCHSFNFSGGGGLTHDLTTNSQLSYMLGISTEFASSYNKTYRIGPWFGILSVYNYKGQNKLKMAYEFYLKSNVRNKIKNEFHHENHFKISWNFNEQWDIRLINRFVSKYGSWKNNFYQHSLSLGHFF